MVDRHKFLHQNVGALRAGPSLRAFGVYRYF